MLSLSILSNSPVIAGDGVLYVAPDQLVGYDRERFKHWIDADKDGCDTRAEVLISEAIVKPKIGAKCKLTGGKWRSPYDEKTYTSATKLDVDHWSLLQKRGVQEPGVGQIRGEWSLQTT